ncbi:MAG: urea transporter [Planctomycetes bacterium]|nr:urea transporter [Planctomycetota bacterium]
MAGGFSGAGGRGGGEDFYRAFLAGYGALFFSPRPVSGALFLLGTFAANSVLGAAVLVGLLASTAAAHLLRRAPAEIEHGLYGFNGALAAFAVFSLDGPVGPLHLAAILAAALTVPVAAWLIDGPWCRKLALPCLSLPSLAIGFPALLVLAWAGGFEPYGGTVMPPYLVASSLFDPHFYGAGMRDAAAALGGEWAVVLLFAAGFLAHSWRLLLHAVLGLLLGALSGFAFLGWYGASNFMFVVVTAAPVYLALAAIFTAGGLRSFAFGAAGVVISFFVWFHLGLLLADFELPLLTAPFCATTAAFLLLLRFAPNAAAAFLPRLVPLHRVGTPEQASEWARDFAFGVRFWQGIAGLKDRPWTEYASGERMARARELVRQSRRVAVLTGAGVSTESGIPDYRGGAVAWKRYDPEHFRFPRFLESEESRRKYWEMSQDFYLLLRTAEPNAAHKAVAELDRLGKLEAVITQNVDRLHQRAGVPPDRVIEIHGSEHSVSCLRCGLSFERETVYRWILEGMAVPYCPTCQGILKPDSVAFGQPLREEDSERALAAVSGADLLLIAGTSLEVQPVAALPLVALRRAAALVIVNLERTDYDPFAAFVFRGACGSILPELCRAEGG